jgi:hypothetical protein
MLWHLQATRAATIRLMPGDQNTTVCSSRYVDDWHKCKCFNTLLTTMPPDLRCMMPSTQNKCAAEELRCNT